MSLWFLPSAFAVVLLSGLFAYAISRNPPAPLRPALLSVALMSLTFAVGDTLTFFVDASTRSWQASLAISIQYTGIIMMPPTWFVLIVRFAQANNRPFQWGRSRWVYSPFALTGLVWLAMITNPIHGQFLYTEAARVNETSWLWAAHALIGYCVSFAGIALCVILGWRIRIKSTLNRVYFMLATPLLISVANLLYLASFVSWPFDPTPLASAIAAVLFMFGSYRTGFFALSPLTLTSIISSQPSGNITTDHEGFIATWNPAAQRILGTSIERIEAPLCEWLAMHITEPDTQEIGGLTATTLKKQITTTAQTHLGAPKLFKLNKPQGPAWIRLELTELSSWRASAVTHSIQIEDHTQLHTEQTQRIALMQRVSAAQKHEGLSVLAGGVAHDFNNVLMTMRGNLELLQIDPDISDSARKRVTTIDSAIDRATRLTQQLLAYSGQSTAARHRMSLQSLVADTAELLTALLASKGIRLELDLVGELWVTADRSQLEQIVMNLVINAAEAFDVDLGDSNATEDPSRQTSYSGQKPAASRPNCVTIRTGSASQISHNRFDYRSGDMQDNRDYCFLEVADFGSGIRPELLKQIFDPFFTNKSHGTGLGLAAVKGIVTAHEGFLEVESNPGEGSRFRVFLPKSLATNEPISRPELALNPRSALSEELRPVIVIDDEPAVLKVTGDLLTRAGWRVVKILDANAAIQLVIDQAAAFSAAVIDVRMPAMDGFAVLRALRTIRPDLPAVMISGHHNRQFDSATRSLVGVKLVAKPFSGQMLHEALQAAQDEFMDSPERRVNSPERAKI